MTAKPTDGRNPAQQVTHDVSGKVCLVTGANSGIGRVTALELARAGGHVLLACRSLARAEPVANEIRNSTRNERVDLLELDLGSFDSVRACADSFLARGLPLHVLVDNAGLAGAHGQTADGFEIAFGVNHLGHFLFTCLLLDRLRACAPARVVIVSSHSHYNAQGIDFETVRRPTASFSGLHEYNVSKLANVLFSKELARRLAGSGVTTYALHPGTVASDVWRSAWRPARPLVSLMKRFMLSNEEGARTTLHCATAPELANETGLYYSRCRAKHPSRLAQDPSLAAKLWEKSAEWTSRAAD